MSGAGAVLTSEPFRVSTARMAAFAAVFDPDAVYNPVFAHVPVMQSMVETVAWHGTGAGLHAEHDFVFHAPMVAGQTLVTRTRVAGGKRIKAGVLLRVLSKTQDAAGGGAVTTQTTSVLLRGDGAAPAADACPARPAPVPDAHNAKALSFDAAPETAWAYADAARDYAPYTLDADAARDMGFAGPVLHGMATLGFAAQRVADRVCGGDGRRILRLGARFSRPLVVAARVRVEGRMRQDGQVVSFEMADDTGAPILTNGYAEIGR